MDTLMISVVMSVYNGEKYLEEVIESILKQSYDNWELIIVNDASTDSTAKILENYQKKDARIRVLTNETNKKLPASLNYGISVAKGKYILRVDADDICTTNRFERQLRYMETHPDVDVTWCLSYELRDGIIQNNVISYSVAYEKTKASLLMFGLVNHSGILMKRSLFEEYAYDPEATISEDLRLWLEILQKYKMQGMREYLTVYRIHSEQATNEKNKELQKAQVESTFRKLFTDMDWKLEEHQIQFHMELIYGSQVIKCEDFLAWANSLSAQNDRSQWCSKDALYYLFLWKIDELYRSARLTSKDACYLANRISPIRSIQYMVRKVFTAFADLYYRQKGKKYLDSIV